MAKSTSSWVSRHSLLAYFILAYAISWAIMIPLALTRQGVLQAPIPFSVHYLSSFGPLLAALIVTWLESGVDGLRELFARMTK